MAKNIKPTKPNKPGPPQKSPENQRQYMISIAYDLAEQQILDGTASSQVITHFLKLGSTRDELELELLRAKTDSINATKSSEEKHNKIMEALKSYQGGDDEDYD